MKTKFFPSLYSVLGYLFYCAAAALPFILYQSVPAGGLSILWAGFLSNAAQMKMPASDLVDLKPLLPANGVISLLTDEPFGAGPKSTRYLHDAENFLAPLVLNKQPVEAEAIVSCSTPEIAERRLEETGYVWSHKITGSKGLARKR